MKIKSNKVKDIREYYLAQILEIYPTAEAGKLFDMILEGFTSISRIQRIAQPELRLSESEILKIHFAAKDLLLQKPVQYILGKTCFYDISLTVNSDVLIPRPETEELVEWIINDNKHTLKLLILDIGTGSGAIALALAKHLHHTKVHACDNSREALALAQKNAESLSIKVNFFHANIFDPRDWNVPEEYDIIVSNPPYVTESEKPLMQKNVLGFEPATALFVPDADPLLFYRSIIDISNAHLKPGGKLYFEINERFASEMSQLIACANYSHIVLKKDLSGRDRMIRAGKKL